jgi:hypothetical protein
MASERATSVRPVVEDLQRIFGNRLEAIVSYGWRQQGPIPTLALVQSLTFEDLNACAERARAWRRAGAAIPLLLTRADFARSLDAFPIEYGEIISRHEVLLGDDPFAGLSIRNDDLRRACEVQVKSHLLHLREDYIEGGAQRSEVDELVRESAPGFAAVLRHLGRLDQAAVESNTDLAAYAARAIRLDPRVVSDLLALSDADDLASIDSVKLFPAYLAAVERLAEFVDRWRSA